MFKPVYHLRTRHRLLAFLLALATGALNPPAPLESGELGTVAAARNSITADQLKWHIDALADDTFEGRGAGTPGGRAAGLYLLKEFQKLNLVGAGNDGQFFQDFHRGYRNILGMIHGSDPELKNEIILIGAHYDHVGYGSSRTSNGPLGRIHNGADDNASGTAGLLELAKAFRSLPIPTRRSILFALWDGEEQGLLGSKHWVETPTLDIKRVKLVYNLDMIGRLQPAGLEIYGTRTAQGLRRLICHNNTLENLSLLFNWKIQNNSDHYPFFTHGIPFLMPHTGLHPDYHRPSDDSYKINFPGVEQIGRLSFDVIYQLAELDELANFRSAARQESPRSQQRRERPLKPLPARLGVMWNRHDTTNGLKIIRINSRSPARRSALRIGDRLISINGQAIDSTHFFQAAVLAAPLQTTLGVLRDEVDPPLDVPVTLVGKPVRLGISWRADPSEPGTVILIMVRPGSPAATAGLKLRDRIYEINRQPFHSSDELLSLATSSPLPIQLLVERNGKLILVELPDLLNQDAEQVKSATNDATDAPE